MTLESLKHCFTCKKKLGEKVNIYMYKSLAFCGVKCRKKEIDKDEEEDKKQHVKILGEATVLHHQS
ncbi:putative Zf-FLZ domain-containing protein [Helianthus annuus]|uniref:Zf-FLZ domain-containing protein n=1 Tax=Helianthus annuus TaxID=4232 RepID=A0A251TQ73_HELAN|nr:putative Zf-FLZ domain-containing protein [Helianthus annuus]KAJ0885383.1 putative Zf-FLZ domain-containing protein [Helianthus annuus]